MAAHFDCIVLGVGGFGSAALYHLAKCGVSCLGIEAFGIAHDRGSSHGETRVIRKAYFEHPDYVPLCQTAYQLWAELEAESATTLYEQTGLLLAGPADGEAVAGARKARDLYQVPLEDVSLKVARERFPGFQFAEGHDVVFEPEARFFVCGKMCANSYRIGITAWCRVKNERTCHQLGMQCTTCVGLDSPRRLYCRSADHHSRCLVEPDFV